MRREFIVERQGKSFALYAGLLDMAHQSGLKSIRTEILQLPTTDTDNVAICMATVVLEKDGREQTFTGIADASPRNVAQAMQTCLLKMSETRAKARALRDAVNVGMACAEELSEDASDAPRPARKSVSASNSAGKALPSQVSRIQFLCGQLGEPVPDDLENLTQIRAQQIINEKQAQLAAKGGSK